MRIILGVLWHFLKWKAATMSPFSHKVRYVFIVWRHWHFRTHCFLWFWMLNLQLYCRYLQDELDWEPLILHPSNIIVVTLGKFQLLWQSSLLCSEMMICSLTVRFSSLMIYRRGLNEMVVIIQTTLSSAYCWVKIIIFDKSYLSMFPRA